MVRRSVASILLAVIVAGCIGFTGDPTVPPTPRGPATASPTTAPTPTATPVELTIYAAASLKGALEKAKTDYEAAYPGTTITISTDSSSALETKIEQGAPADVFLSADTTNPKKLEAAGLTSGAVVNFAGNELVIIVPSGQVGGVVSPYDLARPGLKIVAAGDSVPITKYAAQLIENLAALPDAPAGFEAAYAANVVSKEENVTAVVAKVELGEGDAAIVYATDARASGKVTPIAINPASANVRATYAGVVVAASTDKAPAAAFLAWLAGADGQAIMATFGFMPAAA